jgi:hypothetical protein
MPDNLKGSWIPKAVSALEGTPPAFLVNKALSFGMHGPWP